MKKILIHLLKPLSFLPAILMMYLIYSFSAQTGEVSGALSYEVSYQIVETKNEVLNENKTYDELAYSASSIEFYVRKDRVLSACHCHFFPTLCLRSKRYLADPAGRRHMRRLRRL